MHSQLKIYNTLSREKEIFEPKEKNKVGMYVCGPTVYGDAHLGHARPAITFDIVSRYLRYKGFDVTFVRNITDVGHLENDADEGDDKILKKAKQENLDPFEIARNYTKRYHRDIDQLNVIRPNIEPLATEHIQEQIAMAQQIIDRGLGYEVNGSVYFDLKKYSETGNYGSLSGRILDDLLSNTRSLDGQQEKRYPLDFALWKKAPANHIMQWDSPWGKGFPGWHIECSAMSTKYLGETFDIHGGGMDLKFPHHECEMAQCEAAHDKPQARYWMHNNLISINGQKMSKSLNNFITLEEVYTGDHALLEDKYSPMAVRFFILQAHYRGSLDFSNEALSAAKKGFNKLMNVLKSLKSLEWKATDGDTKEKIEKSVQNNCRACLAAMDDDFNTALAISHLFKLSKVINNMDLGNYQTGDINEDTFRLMKKTFVEMCEDVLGFKDEMPIELLPVIEEKLAVYKEAKASKDYDVVDEIRAALKKDGIIVRDMKHKIDWSYEE